MEINKRNRTELKSYFVKNAIPTASNFADLIEGALNQKDDGIVKLPGDPLSIEAAGDATSLKKAINFYRNFNETNPDWTITLNPRSDPNNASTAKLGFNISDGEGNSRLFIDRNTGNVGVGTVNPQAKLHLSGPMKIDGSNTLEFGAGVSGKEVNAGKIGYQTFTADALDIIGAGTTGTSRKIKLWAEGGATVAGSLTLTGNLAIGATGSLSFDNRVRQMLNLWSTEYGIGIQNGTQYFRTAKNFAWYKGGAHHDAELNAGGGTVQMVMQDGSVGIGTAAPAYKLTVSAASTHLQLLRESTETTGGKQVFLELLQLDPTPVKVPEVYPSIRFHHNNRFWHRIEARSDGFHFKEGSLSGDGYVSVRTGEAYVSGNLPIPGGVETLRMLRGIVNSNGTVFAGSGFSVSRAGVGLFDITFTQAFSSIPGASATQIFGRANTGIETATSTGGDPRDNAVIAHLSANMMRVKTGDSAGNASDRVFAFLVIGPR
jgi:hypothetical protein